ncbi:SusC/RagA family TonB-linked outer membrane protein [Flavisolibacter nicotianae]|uniref:SusC/RagA family TonB-linked outer membrane protein n=1 Tax=Flavisolibacter nicotianae TaxID=2364882 RepID=UPI000EACC114|nr:SusC/RagA family TonB-linked outer membrane protein [Flavisolibacter nicotianae]
MQKDLQRFIFLLGMLLACSVVFAQQRTITGVVTNDESKEPLSGVSISVKGTDRVTSTNEKGQFSILVSGNESVLKISSVGYLYKEITVGGQNSVSISLAKDVKQMDEVVVIGYGTQRKTHLTGSVGTVDVKRIEDFPGGNLSQALKGQVVGVSVSGGYSRPGEAATISIRNPISFSKDAPKDPLYVIDDIIRTKADFDLLDATEIENISVLKDASAAIYGIMGSNGVIVVRTKRGRAGAPVISYTASAGISDATSMPKMMTGYQQALYMNDYLNGSKNWDQAAVAQLSGIYTQDEVDYFKTHNYDWLKNAWQKAYNTRHALNVSGGSDRATYFAGFTYSSENSNFDGLGYKRYSFRSSSDIKLAAGLKLGLALSGNLSDRKNTFNKQGNESLDNDWKTLIGENQGYTPYINGLPILIPGAGTSSNINTYHYFAVHELNNYTSSYNTGLNFQGQLSYEIPFIKGLKAAVNYNKNIANSWGKQYGTKYTVYDFNKLGSNGHILGDSVIKTYTWSNGDRVRLNPTITKTYQLNTTVNYDRTFGKHQIGALFVYEQAEAFSDGVAGQVDGVVVGGLDNQNFAVGTSTNPDGSSNETISEAGRMAYIGRLNYSFANKYLFEANLRADASQNFAPENRWGYFPSLSAGWVVSDENFFDNLTKTVNYLKIRGSVGFMGIDNTKSYQWLRSYAIQTGKAAVFGGNSDRGLATVMNIDLANRAVHWDNQDKYDIGLDARFLRNRLSISTDWYINKSYNMLSSLTSSPSILIGTALPTENFGKANVFGYELSANWRDNIGKNWSYNVTTNFNWNDNRVLVADVPKGDIGTFKDQNGKSNDMGFYGYHSLGILRTQAEVDAYVAQYNITDMLGYKPGTNNPIRPGMLAFADVRGKQNATTGKYDGPDGVIDVNDQDFLKAKQDNHYGLGINWGVSYKTVSLNVVMGMSWGGISSVESAARKVGTAYSNRPSFWSDHWTPDNINAAYPSPYYTSTYDVASDFWWRSSFTFRVTTFNLSYTLPRDLTRRAGLNNVRLFLNGTNPVNFFNPYDYKDNINGSYDVFPQLRTFNFGLNVNL